MADASHLESLSHVDDVITPPAALRQAAYLQNLAETQRHSRQGRMGDRVTEKSHAAGSDKHSQQRTKRGQENRGQQGSNHERFSEHGDVRKGRHECRRPA